jgi:flagellar basal body rod protein FlgC
MGRIRTNGEVRTPMGNRSVILNVDVQPKVMRDGKVRVDLSIEYVNALEASRAYEANVSMMEVSKAMINASLRLIA